MTKYIPGLELDILIAEKVLGWYHESEVGGPRAWWFSPEDSVQAKELPRFSTDIGAAWQLAERFRIGVVPFQRKFWIAYQEWLHHDLKCAPTASHAICLVVLAKSETNNVEST